MNSREHFFVQNYSLFGESSARRCGYNKKEVRAIKDKYKEKGVYMLPVRKVANKKMPAKKGTQPNDGFSSIGFAIACLDYDDQNKIIELSKNIPNPNVLIDETIALQLSRIGRGYQAEQEQGRLLDSTEAAIQNYVNMIQAKKNIEEGQELNVNVNSTISSLIDEIDEEEDSSGSIDFDYDRESKKHELKELRTQGINDLLDDLNDWGDNMSEENKEVTREEFIEEMTNFENVTAPRILKILEEEQHMLSVETLGLIGIVRALVRTYGDEFLMDSCVSYLQFQEPTSEDIPDDENLITEEE